MPVCTVHKGCEGILSYRKRRMKQEHFPCFNHVQCSSEEEWMRLLNFVGLIFESKMTHKIR